MTTLTTDQTDAISLRTGEVIGEQESSNSIDLLHDGQQKPRVLEPVLAKIFALNDLGATIYHEVVYHDGENWRSYHGSVTFNDGEQVKKWLYVNEVM